MKQDIIVIGAGPAGLSFAIQLKKKLIATNDESSIIVLDKALKSGYQNLSGALFEDECLKEIIDSDDLEHPFIKDMNDSVVIEDKMLFLTKRFQFKVPPLFLPKNMKHKGNKIISISQLTSWLEEKARKLGVEVIHEFTVNDILVEDDKIVGVKLKESGIGLDCNKKENYHEGESIFCKLLVVADGAKGLISRKIINRFDLGKEAQIYSVGIKQIIKTKTDMQNTVKHTLGYPNPLNMFGGGFIYTKKNIISTGMVVGLDWKYSNYDPAAALEMLKSHKIFNNLNGEVISYGSKIIPEGGFKCIPKLYGDGFMLLGDSAGLVNVEKLKGLHYSIKSGIASAKIAAEAIESDDYSSNMLSKYETELKPILEEIKKVGQLRQSFQIAGFASLFLKFFNIKSKEDYKYTTKSKVKQPIPPKNHLVNLSRTTHLEDQPSHIKIKDHKICLECNEKLGSPCTSFCPGAVYSWNKGLVLSPSNCLHDMSCHIKCPYQNIDWTYPESGGGPKYKDM